MILQKTKKSHMKIDGGVNLKVRIRGKAQLSQKKL